MRALVPERMLGDVVISVDTARRQAARYGAPLDVELRRLLIHGVLHLLGHDHEQAGERAIMEAEERRLAAAIGLDWPAAAAVRGEGAARSNP
jgi:probable rRNA maturation factor